MSLSCNFHVSGRPPHVKANGFYLPGCPQCEEKRTRGIVTGTEPSPGKLHRNELNGRALASYRKAQAERRRAG